jgi:hypothetical protein
MVELELHGLNSRQQVLADIMWNLDGFDEVEGFIRTLPKREAAECRTIIDLMKMALVEEYAQAMSEDGHEFSLAAADALIDKIRR